LIAYLHRAKKKSLEGKISTSEINFQYVRSLNLREFSVVNVIIYLIIRHLYFLKETKMKYIIELLENSGQKVPKTNKKNIILHQETRRTKRKRINATLLQKDS